MVKLDIIFVGTLKERWLTDAVAEYEKRISAWTICRFIRRIQKFRSRPERLSDKPSPAEVQNAIKREGERIIAAIPPRSHVIALCVEGKQLSSPEFSEKLVSLESCGVSEFCFIIGGSDGLSDEVKKRAAMHLSISEMTFPHQLMRVILLEQIYRAFSIASGGKYHK